jgi:putative transposase
VPLVSSPLQNCLRFHQEVEREVLDGRKNFTGQSFWARGYYVSTVGRDEETVRNYIKHQESEDKRIEQLNLF